MKTVLGRQSESLGLLSGQLYALSPLSVLGRGYAIVRQADSNLVITDQHQVGRGEKLHVQLARGELSVIVSEAAEKVK